MRELPYVESPERHELFALFLINELLAARAAEQPVLNIMLPAAEGAEVDLPVPALYADLLGDRTRTTLNLPEALHRYLDLGGYLNLAVGVTQGRMDAPLLAFSQHLMVRPHATDVRAFEDMSAFAAVGHYAAIEASMNPGPFRLDRGIFRYYARQNEVEERRRSFTALFKSGRHVNWREVHPR